MKRQLNATLNLDQEMLPKVTGYYIYRGEEQTNGRPTVDGVYIKRGAIDNNPPTTMTLLLAWE